MSFFFNSFRRIASRYMRNVLFPRKRRQNNLIYINFNKVRTKSVFRSSGNSMVKSNGGLRGGATRGKR